MLNAALLFLLHAFVWFSLGAVIAMFKGHGAMRMLSAAALAVFSTAAHLIAQHLGYLP